MRLERRTSTPASLVLLNIALVLGLMAATGSVLIAQAGAPVGASWLALLNGAFGSKLAITETLTRATPLIFTGLACAIAFRSRLWNIGAEGQLYAGALAVAALGSGVIQAPGYVLIPIVMLAAALAGAAMLMGPALLKRYMNVDDVVTTLLLNFIMALFVSIMVQGPMRDPMSMGWPQTLPVLDEATLDKLITQSRLHTGLLLALALFPARTHRSFELLFAGSCVFAGSLYLLVLLNQPLLGAITPIGGVLLITGWVTLGLSRTKPGPG